MAQEWGMIGGAPQQRDLLCPKPRRVAPQDPFLQSRPWWWSFDGRPHAGPECDASSEIMEIFFERSIGESGGYGSTPVYFSGSPPSRASNPLVNDVQFKQLRLSSDASAPLSDPMSRPATFRNPTPLTRIEGFNCAGQDSTHSISAMA